MPAIDALFGQPLAEALGWALLHSIWQIALIGAIATGILALVGRGAADVRYVVSAVALALMLTWPAVTAWSTWSALTARQVASIAEESPAITAPSPRSGGTSVPTPAGLEAATPETVGARDLGQGVEAWLPLVLMVWLGGVTLLTLRLLMGWVLVERLRVRARQPAGAAVRRIVARVTRRLHVAGPVAAFESAAIDVPAVIGWLKPVLLVPVSAVGALSPDQLEAIIAHEIAHVRRHDYLVNLLQTVVETLLFYHPAAWWMSRRSRIEREHCCDDLAVALCGDAVRYARALADLEGLRARHGRLALAATDGSLVGRVRRLLGASPRAGRSPAWLGIVPAVALVVIGVAGASAMAGQVPMTGGAAGVPVPTIPRGTGTEPVIAAQAVGISTGVWPAVAAESVGVGLDVEPVVAAAAEASAQGVSVQSSKGESRIVHSDGTKRLEVRYRGTIELAADDQAIKSVSPDGYLIVSDGNWFWSKDYRVEIRPGRNGALESRFWVDGREQPFEPEGREWLAKTLLRLVRTSGFAADSRVARILEASGPAGLLDEIALLEGDYVRRIYFEKLFDEARLDGAGLGRALTLAGRTIASDYEMSRVLRKAAQTQPLDDGAAQAAFVGAAAQISSDYELQRTLAVLIERGPLDEQLVVRLLDTASHLSSDYELSRLLVRIAETQRLEGRVRDAFLEAAGRIGSSHESGKVMTALVTRERRR